MNAAQYAAHIGVTERTVLRWLKAGELPAATKAPDGRWFIPPDAVRQVTSADMSPDVSVTRQGDIAVRAASNGHPQPANLADALSVQPALLSLEDASRLLGIPESAIRRHAEQLGAVPWGARGTLVVPARVVRNLAGL